MLQPPRFSPVIQLGQIINALTFAASLLGAAWLVSSQVTENKKDIDFAKATIVEIKTTQNNTLQTLNTLSAAVARIEGRLSVKQPEQ